MSQINRLGSTKVTLRSKANFSENAFPGKKVIYSKRKAEFSPAKLKIVKRPALNDLTNDGKMRKVKSIIKNDKPLKVIKEEKCAVKEEDALKVKSTRTVSRVRLPPFQPLIHSGAIKVKSDAATLKTAVPKTKPASKSAVPQTKLCTVQTLLTAHAGNGQLRRSSRLQNEDPTLKKESTTKKDSSMRMDSRLQNENETSKKESTTKKDSLRKIDSRLQNENETSKKESTTKKDSLRKIDSRLQNENETSKKESTTNKENLRENESTAIELLYRRRSLRSNDSVPVEAREPIVVIQKLDKKIEELGLTIYLDEAPAENRVKPARRSSARLSLRKSSTIDKSSECNSLYVSALEEITNRDKKYDGAELTEFDKELIHDPHQVALYAAEIFDYLKSREDYFLVSDYMSRLLDITKDMRTILVDWMVEVQENFELNHETLYLSVKIVDAYLDKITEIRRDKLQLVGVTAMFVACKYDERLSPLLEDFVYVCDGAYEPKDILAMEQRLLDTLKYELSFPISYSFLRRYARCARVPMPLLTLARYILELSLLDYSTVTLSDSKQAAAALYLAFRMVKHSDWTESLASYSGYKLEDFKDIVFLFNSILRKKFPEEVKAVRTKYSHEIFFAVSKTPLLCDEEL